MKRKIKYLITYIILSLALNVYASGSINISTTNINMTVNDRKTFTISASNSAGRVDIVPSNSCISVSQSSVWLDNDSASVTITSNSACNASININVNAASYDEEELIYTKTISVTVNEPVTEPITEPTTTKPPETTKVPETTKKRVTTNSTSTTTTTNTTTKIQETIFLDHLEVDGYDIEFDKEKTNYSLEVAYNVKSVNIIAISDNYEITGNIGKIELKEGMNKIEVVAHSKNNSEEKKYTINIKKLQKNEEKKSEKKNETSKNSKMLEFFTILLVIECSIVICLLLYKLFFKKRIELPKFKS